MNLLGLLGIHVERGVNLAIRDVISSDPYVIIKMGKQKLKTRVVKKNLNPKWNDDLTLTISDPHTPIHLHVYDKDRFSMDDKMGDAEFDISPFVEAVKMRLQGLPNDTIITRVQPSRQNCLAGESHIVLKNGKVVQKLVLRLRNVECGEVEIQLHWIDIPGSKAL
ncbi:putative C2 domain-containing protein [Medicago truncatula]|uniref:Calcium-dependent lipid-binding (CaLB domain) family protein n=1 Tax=Medicago truncatula TaxID=3880 RepID=A0A072V3U3_MEDTR|nr:protein C2-DOMAIN ABA-RELATED 4 [Medicago truncatula]KEH36497.1 calcium-dependent lipid-binding (CaLB domain) family protein [Medicago truncatula]RHN71824.1 putative C2 domain-containing protein [Medicago truncatula]